MSYKDRIGQELAEGDYVAGMHSGCATPEISRVVGFTPKKVRIESIVMEGERSLRFPKDLIKVDKNQVTKFISFGSKDAIGQSIGVGDYVIGNDGEYIDLVIFHVIGLTGGQLEVEAVGHVNWGAARIKYWHGHDVIKVPDPQIITMHLLKGKD